MTVFNSSVNFYAYAFKHVLMKNANFKICKNINEDTPTKVESSPLCGTETGLKYELLPIKNLE